MPHRKAERRGATIATAAVALGHFYLGVLGLLGRLSYTQPSRHDLLEFAQRDHFWGPVHLVIALLLLVGLKHPSLLDATVGRVRRDYHGVAESWLCNVSFTALLVWGFFNLLAGLTAIKPVALGAPGLAMIVALGAHLLSNAWMRLKDYDDKVR